MAYEKRTYTDTVEEVVTYQDMNRIEEGIYQTDKNKVDKVDGKGLSTEDYTAVEKEKLASVDNGANNYTHPESHQASMIIQDSERMFVSDIEKETWNAKETTEGSQEKANEALTSAKEYADEKLKLNGTSTNVNFIGSEDGYIKSIQSNGKEYLASKFRVAKSILEMIDASCVYLLSPTITVNKSDFGFGADFKMSPSLEINNLRAIYFRCEKGKTYNILKSTITDRDRTCVTTLPIENWNTGILSEYTLINGGTASNEVYHQVTAPVNGYIIYSYSNSKQIAEITVNENKFDFCYHNGKEWVKNNMLNMAVTSKGVNVDWDKWQDVRYNYGFNTSTQPVFNTFNGVLETDTMISVRGGKGRWNGTDFPGSAVANGGHLFEGWNADETFRFTELIGRGSKAMSCVMVYSPAGLSEVNRRF